MSVQSTTLHVSKSSGGDPVVDLARESRLLRIAAEGQVFLAFCSWSRPVVVLGYAQPENDVDLELCRNRGIPVLRRLSGGTGVLHNRDLSLALALPGDHEWSRGVRTGYQRFLDVLEPSLRKLGADVHRIKNPGKSRRDRSPICFEDQLSETLLIGVRKVVGCAQARRARGVLIHATILRNLDAGLYGAVFGVKPERIEENLAPLGVSATDNELVEVMTLGFAKELDLAEAYFDPPPPKAADLEPYSTRRWSPMCDVESK